MEAEIAGVGLGIAVAVATLLGVVKSTLPKMDRRFVPVLALVLASGAVAVGAWSGEVEGAPLELVLLAIAETATVIGARELFRAVVPQ